MVKRKAGDVQDEPAAAIRRSSRRRTQVKEKSPDDSASPPAKATKPSRSTGKVKVS